MKYPTARHSLAGLMIMLSAAAAQSQAAPAPVAASKAAIGATHPDISFFVVGKSSLYAQDAQGKLSQPSYYLFSEVFLRDGGKATRADMTYPGGRIDGFTMRGNAFRVQRRDFATRGELDKAFANGSYAFTIEAPGGNVAPFAVNMRPRRDNPFPPAITITLQQGGKTVAQNSVDPTKDLLITWTPFDTGRGDPGGVSGDVSFSIMGDCHGNSVARSELPFKSTPALSYADRSFRVPAERLSPATAYKLHVEHAELVDVVNRDGIVGLAAYATVTDTVLSTNGAPAVCSK